MYRGQMMNKPESPRFARRLGLMSSVVLLAGSTWAGLSTPITASASVCPTLTLAQTTFTHTGGQQCFQVPADATSIDVTLVGGKGGDADSPGGTNGTGAFGASVTATVAITNTTISAFSAGLFLPQSAINVVNTTGFPTSGTINVQTSNGMQTVTYGGTTSTSFTGASGGTGQMFGPSPGPASLVTKPQTFYVEVGGNGTAGSTGGLGGIGGDNGGGTGGTGAGGTQLTAGGGGGATDLRTVSLGSFTCPQDGSSVASRVLVAGGGGGGGGGAPAGGSP